MLVGNEVISSNELQVTHSNFDYSKVKTDMCEIDECMYMTVPNFDSNLQQSISLFPTSTLDSALLTVTSFDSQQSILDVDKIKFSAKECPKEINLDSNAKAFNLSIKSLSQNTSLPTRMPFGICTNSGLLHSEMSLGAYTNLRPPKRFHWIHFCQIADVSTTIFATAIEDIYGPAPTNIICRVYYPGNTEFDQCELNFSEIRNGISLHRILNYLENPEFNGYGYLSFFSNHGGLMIFSCLKTISGSLSIEHSF